MGLSEYDDIRMRVSGSLRLRIAQLRGDSPWRRFPQLVAGWKWSGAYANKIARGGQHTVPLGVYKVLAVTPPAIVITLENVDDVEIVPEALAVLVRKYPVAACDVCKIPFYKTVWNQRFCERHSWSTLEGRRWQRSREGREWQQQAPVDGRQDKSVSQDQGLSVGCLV